MMRDDDEREGGSVASSAGSECVLERPHEEYEWERPHAVRGGVPAARWLKPGVPSMELWLAWRPKLELRRLELGSCLRPWEERPWEECRGLEIEEVEEFRGAK